MWKLTRTSLVDCKTSKANKQSICCEAQLAENAYSHPLLLVFGHFD